MNFPLKNKLFISTRPTGQSDELIDLLEQAGAKAIEMPLIEIKSRVLSGSELELMDYIEQFQWIIFTSPNGVYHFFETRKEREFSSLPDNIQIAVIGKKTEKVLSVFGYRADFVNPGNTSEDFVFAFADKIRTEKNPKILLAVGNLARTFIQDKLKDWAECSRIDVYKTEVPNAINKKNIQLIKSNQYEMLIFTSPSAIQNFMTLTNDISVENIRLACIGEITAREARKQGLQPLIIAKDASAKGIVDSIIQYYS